jgi:single-stranded-DNA-specific exonuclease
MVTTKMPTIEAIQSVSGISWRAKPSDDRVVLSLMQKFDLPEIVARIINSRGIGLEKAQSFLDPRIKDLLPDPFSFIDMAAAASELVDALKKDKKIVVFGDYDVDGATSSALLINFFKAIGKEISAYIPDRILEGYGPNKPAFKKLKAQGVDIVVTVDCGAASYEQIEYAHEIGLKIIVIDHHVADRVSPEAVAVVNPNRADETGAYSYLAAVGVTFLLIVAINSLLRKDGYYKNIKEPSLMDFLDLVALGTVCDVVPLEGINRAFVTQGLKVLAARKNLGLQILSDIACIDTFPSTYHLGFVLGPRINAGGRVGESFLGTQLLSTDNYEQASEISSKLDLYNSERKAIEIGVLEQAFEQAETLAGNSVIMVTGKNWHQGVIGIVASRIKDRFNKPVIVISVENGVGKASCRSIKGVDMGAAIIAAKNDGLVIVGGGHKMAAGFTINEGKIIQLQDYLDKRFHIEIEDNTNRKTRYFDSFISTGSVNLEIAKKIEILNPFGVGNPEPRFIIKEAIIIDYKVLKESHISCIIGNANTGRQGKVIKAMAFRAIDTPLGNALLQRKAPINLVGYIRINRWQGTEKADFIIEDLCL